MTSTPTQIVIDQLQSNPGIFIGDQHGELNIPEWFVKNMGTFKASGVEKMYMEMVRSDQQHLIDAYYKGEKNADIRLQSYLEHYWEGKSPGTAMAYFEMIKAAKENGIKVHGIDNETNNPQRRLDDSNPHWAHIINTHNNELSQGGKYLVFGGNAHSANYTQNKGVDHMLGIPSMDFASTIDATGNPIAELASKAFTVENGDKKSNNFLAFLPPSPNQRGHMEKPAEKYQLNIPNDLKFNEKVESIKCEFQGIITNWQSLKPDPASISAPSSISCQRAR